MAQFDVFRMPDGFALDCQSDWLSDLDTCFTVPLLPKEHAPIAAQRLNPCFVILDAEVIMVTQFAGTVLRRSLGERIGSLAGHDFAIKDALDLLFSGG